MDALHRATHSCCVTRCSEVQRSALHDGGCNGRWKCKNRMLTCYSLTLLLGSGDGWVFRVGRGREEPNLLLCIVYLPQEQ